MARKKAASNGHVVDGPRYDPIAVNRLARAIEVHNDLSTSRRNLLSHGDDRRSIAHECGYPEELTVDDYWAMYDRNGVARRVVQFLPRETWRVSPEVFEDEDPDTQTDFEEAWDQLGRALRGEDTHYGEEKASAVWDLLRRADELAGVGNFGVIYLGLDDVDQPGGARMPVRGFDERNSVAGAKPGRAKKFSTYALNVDEVETAGRKLLFACPYGESAVTVTQWEQNPTSPRFGKPAMYQIQVSTFGRGEPQSTFEAHWTRCVHILSDDTENSEVFSVSRLHAPYNRLYDIDKIQSADGEAYWRNCVLKLFFETHPELGGDVEVDKDEMRDEIEAMMNGLQQWMTTRGMSAKAIPPAVTDPTPHWEAKVKEICLLIGAPMRIFIGSERGELASSQDERAHVGRLKHREEKHVTPRIICPFIGRLINVGVLPTPADGYQVAWPDRSDMTEVEKATTANLWVDVMAKYLAGGVRNFMDPLDFATRIMRMSEEEAEEVLRNALEKLEETMPEGTEEPPVVGKPDAPPAPEVPEEFGEKDEDEEEPVAVAK